jgi:hypothetical protein
MAALPLVQLRSLSITEQMGLNMVTTNFSWRFNSLGGISCPGDRILNQRGYENPSGPWLISYSRKLVRISQTRSGDNF